MKVLDIGAGNTSFWKKLRSLNPQIQAVICGDIKFQKQEYDLDEGILSNIGVFLSRVSKILTKEELEHVIEETKKWVFKVFADYREIPLQDESMDMVTLNSPHPFFPVRKEWFEEIRRVLKRGWIFYFWHSIKFWNPYPENEMRVIGEWNFRFNWEKLWKIDSKRLIFPMSPYIAINTLGHHFELRWQKLNTYWGIYDSNHPCKIQPNPNWKVWEKV